MSIAEDKLKDAFLQFRPHINGHVTAMETFDVGIQEVRKMDSRIKELEQSLRNSLECHELIYKHNSDMLTRSTIDNIKQTINPTIVYTFKSAWKIF